ncbi:MAG: bifunctional oligoribonuclease/PAP phosphatase NrnA [Bacteroidia bacterium]|nr:bifunctional oligoribonuclease/PAP phosphatase NrnA [Bacteroidia bacterium]
MIEKVIAPFICRYFVIKHLKLVFRNIVYLYQLEKTAAKVAELSKYTKELTKLFSTKENILLICHINPDGDAIGSQLAIYHYLKSKGKLAGMISPNNLQEFLKWMDGVEEINIFIRHREKCKRLVEEAGLIVMLDFNQADRLGEAEIPVAASKAVKVVIDHHLDPRNFADLMISDPSKCSTSELVNELITEMNGGRFLNRSFAEALYVGIITDTGNFEHGLYTGSTFRMVADLLESGIEKEKIHNLVYNNFSIDRMRLLGFALNQRMVIIPEYQTAYIYLTKEDLAEYNYTKGDSEGFVNMPLSIKGILFTALFIEKDGFIKLSFRSKGDFPTNRFALKYFSGGGHLNASGGDYHDTLDNTIKYFLEALKEFYAGLNQSIG